MVRLLVRYTMAGPSHIATMNKVQVRCRVLYAKAGSVFNNEVYQPIADFGYGYVAATCTSCGELFAIDTSNPRAEGLALLDLAKDERCPKCERPLNTTLARYPDNFLGKGGVLGSLETTQSHFTNEPESKVVVMWELEP